MIRQFTYSEISSFSPRYFISAVDCEGLTAFHYAARTGQLDVVKYFAERNDFNTQTDGVITLSLAQRNIQKNLNTGTPNLVKIQNLKNVFEYLTGQGIPALPSHGAFADNKTIFYDDSANKNFDLELFEILGHYTQKIPGNPDIPSLVQGATLNIYLPLVFEQRYHQPEFIDQQIKNATNKLNGTKDNHLDTNPIFGGSCAYNATKNALVGLMLLHDYDTLVDLTAKRDSSGITKFSQLVTSDIANLVASKTKDFDCASFMEKLHAKTFVLQHQQFLQKIEAIQIQQGFDRERMHIAHTFIDETFKNEMRKRHQPLADKYCNAFSFVDYDTLFLNRSNDCEKLYENDGLHQTLKQIQSFNLLQQISLRTNNNYRHAFILSLNTGSLEGYGASFGPHNRMHAITVIIDKRGSVINVIVCESNNAPQLAIKKILYDFLQRFTDNQIFPMDQDTRKSLVQCASNKFGCWITTAEKRLPSFESLAIRYAQLRNTIAHKKNRDDIHYAFFALSQLQNMYTIANINAVKRCYAKNSYSSWLAS